MSQTAAQETAEVISAKSGIPAPPGINSPEDYATVTPSDSADLPFRCRVVWCGTAGNIAIQNLAGQSVVIPNVPASQWVQLRTNRILNTGTSAGSIVVGH